MMLDKTFYDRMVNSTRERHADQIRQLAESIRQECDLIVRDLGRENLPLLRRIPILRGFPDMAIRLAGHVEALQALRDMAEFHEASLTEHIGATEEEWLYQISRQAREAINQPPSSMMNALRIICESVENWERERQIPKPENTS